MARYLCNNEILEVREVMGRNTYPMEFIPENWEKNKKYTTCYNYSLGINTQCPYMVGDIIGERATYRDSVDHILYVFKKELSIIGFEVEECEVNELTEEGNFKVFVEFDNFNNYHFIREDRDGLWSHKAGGELPTNTDSLGAVICDPCQVMVGNDVGFCFMVYPQ